MTGYLNSEEVEDTIKGANLALRGLELVIIGGSDKGAEFAKFCINNLKEDNPVDFGAWLQVLKGCPYTTDVHAIASRRVPEYVEMIVLRAQSVEIKITTHEKV